MLHRGHLTNDADLGQRRLEAHFSESLFMHATIIVVESQVRHPSSNVPLTITPSDMPTRSNRESFGMTSVIL